MKARYRLLLHCGDDRFQGPEIIELEEIGVQVTLRKDTEAGPGRLEALVDFPIRIEDIPCDDDTLIPPNKARELKEVGLYLADVLAFQTGWGEVVNDLDGLGEFEAMERFVDFIPEDEREERFLAGKKRRVRKSLRMSYRVYGGNLLDIKGFKDLWAHRDALACYAEATRLKHPVAIYREMYRILEYFFARPSAVSRFKGTKKKGAKKVLERAACYLQQFDAKYDEDFLEKLKELRDRCSHTARDYITPNDLEGLQALREKIPELKNIARILLCHPPS